MRYKFTSCGLFCSAGPLAAQNPADISTMKLSIAIIALSALYMQVSATSLTSGAPQVSYDHEPS